MKLRSCLKCDAPFTPAHGRQTYCTPEHRQDTHRKQAMPCAACGKTIFKEPSNRYARVCSEACKYDHMRTLRPVKPKRPKLTEEERKTQWKLQRGPLRVAYESGDHAGVISSIRQRCVITDAGCWLWQGSISRDGYPKHNIAGKRVDVHRMALEAKERAPLGSQMAHHTCAVSSCVNPDHLIPATHAENIAEMKARHSYTRRIQELEDALRSLAPEHALLDRAAYALDHHLRI